MSDRDEGGSEGLTAAEFRQLFEAVSTWGRWGADDERGALNYLTPARVLEAARLVRTGETMTLSLPLNTQLGIDNPAPADHRMTMLGDEDIGSGTLRFAKDYVGADYHNPSHTHIDALCHVAFDGTLYNGRPSRLTDSRGSDGRRHRSPQGRPRRARRVARHARVARGSTGSSPASTSSPRTSRAASGSRA